MPLILRSHSAGVYRPIGTSICAPLHVSASKPGKIITPILLFVVVCAAQYRRFARGTRLSLNAAADCDADASRRKSTSRSVAFLHTPSVAQKLFACCLSLGSVKFGAKSTNPAFFAAISSGVHTGGSSTSGMEKHGGFWKLFPHTASTSAGASSHVPQTYDTLVESGTMRLYQTKPSPEVTMRFAHDDSYSGEAPAHVWFSNSRLGE